jgi:hypothetical protein
MRNTAKDENLNIIKERADWENNMGKIEKLCEDLIAKKGARK